MKSPFYLKSSNIFPNRKYKLLVRPFMILPYLPVWPLSYLLLIYRQTYVPQALFCQCTLMLSHDISFSPESLIWPPETRIKVASVYLSHTHCIFFFLLLVLYFFILGRNYKSGCFVFLFSLYNSNHLQCT